MCRVDSLAALQQEVMKAIEDMLGLATVNHYYGQYKDNRLVNIEEQDHLSLYSSLDQYYQAVIEL